MIRPGCAKRWLIVGWVLRAGTFVPGMKRPVDNVDYRLRRREPVIVQDREMRTFR